MSGQEESSKGKKEKLSEKDIKELLEEDEEGNMVIMEGLNKPEPYKLEADVAENLRKFKRDYGFFVVATGRQQKFKSVQAATLLNLIGPEAMDLFETFEMEEADKGDPEKILKAFEAHAKLQPNETFERFVFMSRMRKPDESIEQYIADLKKLSKTCGYEGLTESMVRDNIIRHMSDTKLQQNVLKIKDLTLQTLIENIKVHEASQKQAAEIQGEKTIGVNINTLKDRRPRRTQQQGQRSATTKKDGRNQRDIGERQLTGQRREGARQHVPL